MRTVLIVCTLVTSVALATVATAQERAGKSGSGQGQGSSATVSAAASAPVGHRQPRPADVPADAKRNDSNDTTASAPAVDAADAALERAMRGICRGC